MGEGSRVSEERSFVGFWESTLPPDVPEQLAAHWREHELSAVARGMEIVKDLSPFVTLEGKPVLDIGCGYGGTAVAMAEAGASVVGLDCDPQRLLGAGIRVNGDHPGCDARFVQAVAEATPFEAATFETVVGIDVLEHVRCHALALREISRVLRPGGWLYLTFPNLLSLANIGCDPHYRLFGACLLPPRVGAWYVVALRKRARGYQVGRFPIAQRVIQLLGAADLTLVEWRPAPRRSLGPLTSLWRFYRLNTQAVITLICQKGQDRDEE